MKEEKEVTVHKDVLPEFKEAFNQEIDDIDIEDIPQKKNGDHVIFDLSGTDLTFDEIINVGRIWRELEQRSRASKK